MWSVCYVGTSVFCLQQPMGEFTNHNVIFSEDDEFGIMHNKHLEMWSSYYLKILFVTEMRSLTFYRRCSQAKSPAGVLLL